MKSRFTRLLLEIALAFATTVLAAGIVWCCRAGSGFALYLDSHLWVAFGLTLISGMVVWGGMKGSRSFSENAMPEDLRRTLVAERRKSARVGTHLFLIFLITLLDSYYLNRSHGLIKDQEKAPSVSVP